MDDAEADAASAIEEIVLPGRPARSRILIEA
jgi:hypothetical protein